jgi:hypothetical protein
MTIENTNPYGVQPGQVWRDWDSRNRRDEHYRVFEVQAIDERYATCKVLRRKHKQGPGIVKIKLDRFRPTGNGYKLACPACSKTGSIHQNCVMR